MCIVRGVTRVIISGSFSVTSANWVLNSQVPEPGSLVLLGLGAFGLVYGPRPCRIEQVQAYAAEPLWLVDEVSPWGADVYMATDRAVPDMPMEYLSGTFMTKVFTGPYRDIGSWIAQMETLVKEKGLELEKLYFFYATCPKCAKHFGKNQVVAFANVR